jgi:hypothetical protein
MLWINPPIFLPLARRAMMIYAAMAWSDEGMIMSALADTPPDRLSIDPSSPYYNAEVIERDVGVRFRGVEKTNVYEYCVSEHWVRVEAGNAKDRRGNPLTIKLTGIVEPYYRQHS